MAESTVKLVADNEKKALKDEKPGSSEHGENSQLQNAANPGHEPLHLEPGVGGQHEMSVLQAAIQQQLQTTGCTHEEEARLFLLKTESGQLQLITSPPNSTAQPQNVPLQDVQQLNTTGHHFLIKTGSGHFQLVRVVPPPNSTTQPQSVSVATTATSGTVVSAPPALTTTTPAQNQQIRPGVGGQHEMSVLQAAIQQQLQITGCTHEEEARVDKKPQSIE